MLFRSRRTEIDDIPEVSLKRKQESVRIELHGVLEGAWKNGVVLGSVHILGYNLSRGKLTIKEDEAKIVREIYNMFLYEHKGCFTIARELMKRGIKTSRGKTRWYPSRNPCYFDK